jgi:hypothetical protein
MNTLQPVLLLLLSATLVSIVLIQTQKIKKNQEQVLVFTVVLVLHTLGYVLWNKLYPDGTPVISQNNAKNNKNITELETVQEALVRAKETKKLEFTEDKILPIKTYNPKDCTNDGTCIIPATKANLHGFHEKKGVNPFTQFNSKENVAKMCVRCNRPLTLYNNPATEVFKSTCQCNHCTREAKEVALNSDMCIYCKTSYLQSHQCFSPTKLPNALYLE